MRPSRSPLQVLALVVALAGCGSSPPSGTTADASPAATEAPDASASSSTPCGPVENPPLQAGSHLIGDTEPPVPFSSTPPTSGWHSSGALDVTIHGPEDPLSEAAQVSVLEADGVVVTYRDLPEEDVAALEDLVRSRYDGLVAVTPYERLEPGQVALTAWGTLQTCDGLHLPTVEAFAEDHLGDEVSPGHSG